MEGSCRRILSLEQVTLAKVIEVISVSFISCNKMMFWLFQPIFLHFIAISSTVTKR